MGPVRSAEMTAGWGDFARTGPDRGPMPWWDLLAPPPTKHALPSRGGTPTAGSCFSRLRLHEANKCSAEGIKVSWVKEKAGELIK
jgi:hypothetical protein